MPLALAALFLAAMPAAAMESDDCLVTSIALEWSSGDQGATITLDADSSGTGAEGVTLQPGAIITVQSLTATYGAPTNGDSSCMVPPNQRFVLDGSGPDSGPDGESFVEGLFTVETLGIAGPEFMKESVPENVSDSGVFTSLSGVDLAILEDAAPGDYVARFFLVENLQLVSGSVEDGTAAFTSDIPGNNIPGDGSLILEFPFTVVESAPEPAASPEPAPSTPPAASPVEQPAGGALFVDASGTPTEPTIAVENGALTVSAGGFDTTVAGDGGATAASGPVTSESGSFTTIIEGDIPDGSVVEVWMFSEPRLVAAGLSDGGGTLSIDVPAGEPLDGGDPIPAGTHTMQLLIPTDSGLVAMNVGVTIGGPVPTVVPAGEGPAPIGAFVLAALLAVGIVTVAGRRALIPPQG